jgi:hypothetical protein
VKYPKVLHLTGGRTVKVEKVYYPYAKNVYRVGYRKGDTDIGLLAELFDGYWQEIARHEVRQQYPVPLKPTTEEYESHA